ncbi:exonuclease domain-containing protein [Bifidobacterium sp. ESL0690]|uniref:exonuclease domain-containing protein n=1 Tax=Bifidobacterium sp. ESL0690 TaxID=2983214 RepID=UPI0023F9E0DD|nr:exonuclease domain-containing protein [Bifidobacterium sp. ESL0690]WEV46187.1 exonuclease domain-containing protein [Bifidobacterium sp. ESL0690]
MTSTPKTSNGDNSAVLLDAIAQAPTQGDDTTLGQAWLLGFDTETTGTHVTDAIVSASLVLRDPAKGYQGDAVAEWVVNPHHHMSAGASRVNGFTDEFLEANGAEPADAIAAIGSIVNAAQAKRIPLLAYNAPFDVRMLSGDLKRWKLQALPDELLVVDPLVIDREISHRSGKRTLTYTTEYYGVEPHGDFHDATADTTAAVDLIKPMSTLYPQVGNLKLSELMDWQREAHKKWKESFNKWMLSRGRRPVNDTWL